MRLRKKHNLESRLQQAAALMLPAVEAGAPPLYSGCNDKPLHVEIGCGKGAFVCALAAMHPDIDFVAIERDPNVAITAVERAMRDGLENVRFFIGNADNMPALFSARSVARIYLNFSDPWHKKRHYKRRLTYRTWLQMYLTLLQDDGEIRFKTDNRPLYEFSLGEFDSCMQRTFTTEDLHASELAPGNVMTEYEQLFSAKGNPIYAILARKLPPEEEPSGK